MRPLPPECYVPISPRVSCDHFLPNVVRPLPPDVVRALGELWEVSKRALWGGLWGLWGSGGTGRIYLHKMTHSAAFFAKLHLLTFYAVILGVPPTKPAAGRRLRDGGSITRAVPEPRDLLPAPAGPYPLSTV